MLSAVQDVYNSVVNKGHVVLPSQSLCFAEETNTKQANTNKLITTICHKYLKKKIINKKNMGKSLLDWEEFSVEMAFKLQPER